MRYTSDKNALLRHFKRKPVLFGYLIGDLDDFYFKNCSWAISENGGGTIDEVVLIYSGPTMPTVQAFGLGDGFGRFLDNLIPELPDRFYCHYQADYKEVFEKSFHNEPLGTHLKMKLVSDSFKSAIRDDIDIVRLDISHKQILLRFYSESYPGNYFDDRMLETGKYLGCIDNGKIICVSGVHVHSSNYDVSILGNITTHPEYRGKGLASAVTAKLLKELNDDGKMIALNVKNDNFAAIKCYKKLGFETVCKYEESIFTRVSL